MNYDTIDLDLDFDDPDYRDIDSEAVDLIMSLSDALESAEGEDWE